MLVAIGLNLLSVVARALAWTTVIDVRRCRRRVPRFRLVFSAFSVGLFANAVLPGRIGELARVAVLTRRMPGGRALWATLVGTVFAHRVFDLVPVMLLVVYVVVDGEDPGLGDDEPDRRRRRRRRPVRVRVRQRAPSTTRTRLEGLGAVRRVRDDGAARARRDALAGSAPRVAIFFQILGWTVPAPRGLDGDARVRHPRAAARGRARARC